MVQRAVKERMTRFIAERLERSGLYAVRAHDANSLLAEEKPEVRDQPQAIYVTIHDNGSLAYRIASIQRENREAGFYTAHVIYDDGSFLKPLSPKEKQYRRSLKRYSHGDVDRMIKLRGIEKAVLDLFPEELPELAYYRLQHRGGAVFESIVTYRMVVDRPLDYSHLKRGDKGYGHAYNHEPVLYRLPERLTMTFRSPLYLRLGNMTDRRALLRPFNPAASKTDIPAAADVLPGEEAAAQSSTIAERLDSR